MPTSWDECSSIFQADATQWKNSSWIWSQTRTYSYGRVFKIFIMILSFLQFANHGPDGASATQIVPTPSTKRVQRQTILFSVAMLALTGWFRWFPVGIWYRLSGSHPDKGTFFLNIVCSKVNIWNIGLFFQQFWKYEIFHFLNRNHILKSL